MPRHPGTRESTRAATARGRGVARGVAEAPRVRACIDVLQEKWTLHIVRALLEQGALGFNELRRALGCNPVTLTQRLCRLEEVGVVRRTVHSLLPPRTSYALTPSGSALRDVIDAIAAWAAEHLPHSPQPRTGPGRR